MAAVMLFLQQTTGKTERHTHFCMPLEPVFTRDCGGRVHFTDEPTGNLDSKSSRSVIEAFGSAREKMGATIFMVTHDSFAASFCDRVILFKDGVIYRQLENSRRGDSENADSSREDSRSENFRNEKASLAGVQAGNRKSRREFQDELLYVIKEMSE